MDDRGSSTARARGARRREPRGEARPGRAAPRGEGGDGRAPSPDARGIVQEDIPEGRRGAGGVLSACVRCQLETRERHLTADDSLRADLIARDLAHSTSVCWSAFLHHGGRKKNAQSSGGRRLRVLLASPRSSMICHMRRRRPSRFGRGMCPPPSPATSRSPPNPNPRTPGPLPRDALGDVRRRRRSKASDDFSSRAAGRAPLAPRRPTHPPFHPRRRHRSLTRAEHHEPRREDPRARYGTITSPLVSSSPRVATRRRRLSETKRARTTHTHATFGFLRFSFSKLASILAYLDLSRESK